MTHAKDMGVPADLSAGTSSTTGLWPVLVIPTHHRPDWSTAARFVEALAIDELDDMGEQAAAILGSRVVLPPDVVQQRLRWAIRELQAALDGARLPNDRDNRELHTIGRAEVLMHPHPPSRPTFLGGAVALLDCAGVLDRMGLFGLVLFPDVDGPR